MPTLLILAVGILAVAATGVLVGLVAVLLAAWRRIERTVTARIVRRTLRAAEDAQAVDVGQLRDELAQLCAVARDHLEILAAARAQLETIAPAPTHDVPRPRDGRHTLHPGPVETPRSAPPGGGLPGPGGPTSGAVPR